MTTTTTTAVAAIPATDLDPTGRAPAELVAQFRRDGFARVRGMLDAAEVKRFGRAARDFLERHRQESLVAGDAHASTFTQLVNVWRRDDTMRELTLHPRIAGVARQLVGHDVRVWHDQMLVKEPHNAAATQFHQDRPYWPHTAGSGSSVSCWVALVDVPAERGCMSFLPGTQAITDLRPQDLNDEEDLFRVVPELRYHERVTLPLRAGDVTFHGSYTGHMAGPNLTDDPRIAHVIIYMDAATVYDGKPHVVTNGQGFSAGQRLDGELFPRPEG